MNLFIGRQANRAIARVIAASVLTVASVHLVQAQQPAATSPDSTTTHTAKKAELKKLEQNGYQPSATDAHYPQDIQNAEKKAGGTAGAAQPAQGGQSTQ
jgi:Domain of unknown function (DUF4148)